MSSLLSHLELLIPWCVSRVWTVSPWWSTSFPLTSTNWSHLHSPSTFWNGSLHTCAGRYGIYSHTHLLCSLVLTITGAQKPKIIFDIMISLVVLRCLLAAARNRMTWGSRLATSKPAPLSPVSTCLSCLTTTRSFSHSSVRHTAVSRFFKVASKLLG